MALNYPTVTSHPERQVTMEEYRQLAIQTITQEGENAFLKKIEKNHGHPILKPLFETLCDA